MMKNKQKGMLCIMGSAFFFAAMNIFLYLCPQIAT